MGECYSGGCHRFSDMNWKMREGRKEGRKEGRLEKEGQKGKKGHDIKRGQVPQQNKKFPQNITNYYHFNITLNLMTLLRM
jgi:hypothetical protein